MRRVRGSGDSQGVECKCEGRACSAGAGEACKWPGEPRACTRGADVRGAIRCDAQCAEWPGRGRAPGVLCAGRACASAARVCRRAGCAEPEVRGAERGPCVRPCAVRWGGRVRTHPGSRTGSGSGSGSGFPAGLPQRARTGAKPGGRPQRHPCSVARRPPQRSAARAGGSAGPGRRTGAAPQSGLAPRSPPRAPSRWPARPLPL